MTVKHCSPPSIRFRCIVLSVNLIALQGCTSEEGIDSADDVPPLAWEDCGNGFQCATLDVPLQYDQMDENGPPGFSLPVIRLPASEPEARIGSLITNPGGPGGSGFAWVYFAASSLPDDIRKSFDIIGFDPRGVGASEPSIDCKDNLDAFIAQDLTPDSESERKAVIDVNQQFVDACAEKSAAILPHVGTLQVARDLERLRKALREPDISYVGFSYGTLIGALYADMYPNRIRAAVFDGAVDPALSGDRLIEDQALGFEQQLGDFLDDCKSHDTCAFYSNGDPHAAFDGLMAGIEMQPLPALGDPEGRAVGPGEFWWGVSGALYSPKRWARLSEALALAAEAGDSTELLQLSDAFSGREGAGHYSDSLEQYQAIFSIDNPFPRELSYYEGKAAAFSLSAPRLGAAFPYSALPSALWPYEAERVPAPALAGGSNPIVVVGTTRDPATPYAWAVSLSDQLENGVLLTRKGQGHTGFAGKSSCIDAAVSKYLIELVPPMDGTVCE